MNPDPIGTGTFPPPFFIFPLPFHLLCFFFYFLYFLHLLFFFLMIVKAGADNVIRLRIRNNLQILSLPSPNSSHFMSIYLRSSPKMLCRASKRSLGILPSSQYLPHNRDQLNLVVFGSQMREDQYSNIEVRGGCKWGTNQP